ncbi:minor capsid protein [Allobaculum sp. Allo2]|nr:minor capsid protein [Allobaculum sp. Allo2]
MSTELSRVRVQASLDSFKACGFDEFQIIANPDCCKECQAINGEHFPLPKLASGENAPPMHPNCRCSIAPYEARDEDGDKDFDEAAFDEWCDYMEKHEDDPNAMTWEEWKSRNRGIEQERPMANGARRSNTYILSEKEIEFIKGEAENIGIPLDILSFNEGNVTGVNEVMGLIRIRGDVLPDKSSNNNRDLLSVRAVLAHEYYGHFKHIPSEYPIGDWRDEFRASYEAALNAPNLSDEDRSRLIIDAYERQKEAGEFNGYSEEAKRILFG